VVTKRIEYLKSFVGENESEDKCLLKTIHMPKNLLFLSDKLPKPNYDKQFKSTNNAVEDMNNKNYRSYNKINNSNEINKNNSIDNKGIHIKKPVRLMPLNKIPEEKEKEKEKERGNSANDKENKKTNIVPQNSNNNNLGLGNKNKSSLLSGNNILLNKNQIPINNNNNNKIVLKKDEIYYLDVLSKQKNDLRKLMLKNSNISRRLNYVNNNSQISPSPIKDLNKIFMPNIINKSAPKKINNYKLINNKYYIHSPPYLKNVEKYQKNINKLDYEYGKNYMIKNRNEPKNDILPRLPRRLSPIKNLYHI
jgi:hypothetical protein